jgi:hypothetical protein
MEEIRQGLFDLFDLICLFFFFFYLTPFSLILANQRPALSLLETRDKSALLLPWKENDSRFFFLLVFFVCVFFFFFFIANFAE